jgi:general stress protein CsbA
VLTGARVESITLDPNEGGLTTMRGGNPFITLPAGYIGSALWGSLLVFAGFNTIASQVATALLIISLLLVLLWSKNWLSRIVSIAFILVLALIWAYRPYALRFLILFEGVMSSLYSLWDIIDDLVLRKVNESDASQYSRL